MAMAFLGNPSSQGDVCQALYKRASSNLCGRQLEGVVP
jgi:hypothetical protein